MVDAISKQMSYQTYVYKIHSARLRKAGWKLTLPIHEARKNDEIISLGSSQALRFIDSINGVKDVERTIEDIRFKIGRIKCMDVSAQNKREIKRLYSQLDACQYRPDYMCMIVDKDKDYYRACKGFTINGIKYRRLLGTNGGVKNKTIVFVSERVYEELRRRINNGRDESVEIVPAKLEAYMALACSGSTPVSYPNGILVVSDCETMFRSECIRIEHDSGDTPVVTYCIDEEVGVNASDGFGLMLPALAERWSRELNLDYVVSGVNTRCAFEKGMLFAFDFVDFAEKVAGSYMVKDVWGNEVDIRTVEAVFTTSMLKLWSSYKSLQDYLDNCVANEYTFAISKTCVDQLEHERNLNYQFIQSLNMTDEQIVRLVEPTIREFKDVLSDDYFKTMIFLRGKHLDDKSVITQENDFIKAIMVYPGLMEDPFIKTKVFNLIKKKINNAKVGVIKVRGNYSPVSGDPFALCQSIFGLPITGLLGPGEAYNEYWADRETETVACFRAPMTCHNNIRVLKISSTSDTRYWYQYMNTCTVFNSWDLATSALNGCDFDGDIVLLTDNEVILDCVKPLPAIMCIQKNAQKIVPTEQDLIASNVNSFGDDIGKITNRITTMYELLFNFIPGSPEYNELQYRIQCGQKYQQDAIDKAKGIVSKPMPKYWYDRAALSEALSTGKVSPEKYDVFSNIVADKKPYFMKYIYPKLMSQYNTYIKNTEKKAMREFCMSVDELKYLDVKTEQQSAFVSSYDKYTPVGMSACVMNKICMLIEKEFDRYVFMNMPDEDFDYSVLKSGEEYSGSQYNSILRLYEAYNYRVKDYMVTSRQERVDSDEYSVARSMMVQEFKKECELICPNKYALSDIVIDICYARAGTKQFAWDICTDTIIDTLIRKTGGVVSYPALDDDGDICYSGDRFSIRQVKLDNDD